MVKRPLGCLTGLGLLAALITAIAIVGAAAASSNGIFSPGALNAKVGAAPRGGINTHAELASQCEACHVPFWSAERMGDRCLGCHTEIQAELSDPTTLHFGFADGGNCGNCHTEHHGPQATLTRADMRGFPHQRTGFLLDSHKALGEGGTFRCEDCHGSNVREFDLQTCTDCHQPLAPAFMADHTATFGSSCLDCHDGHDRFGKAFDHKAVAFPLEGKHADIPCSQCHVGAHTVLALQQTPRECIACHQPTDVHEGRLGQACEQCHAFDSWQSATIDHAITGFVLTASHLTTDCQSCHAGRQWHGIPTSCVGCHSKDDPHGGQFKNEDCSACHAPTRWQDLHFDHSRTNFVLADAHSQLACTKCHVNGQFAGTPTACIGCHQKDDAHGGELGTNCGSCHKPTQWKDVTFNHASVFALEGKHASIDCAACHTVPGHFSGLPTNCAGCHQKNDAHNGELGTNCGTCHRPTTWSDVTFNHNSVFALVGKHASISCAACHTTPGRFSGLPTNCAGCHLKDDAHGGQFGTDCGSCHKPTSWADATFDHSRSGFPLTGAHISLACTKCHSGGNFGGLSPACVSCHSEPAVHAGQFGTNCSACHSTSAWLPASFNGPHPFPINHGGANAQCAKCHPSSLSSYTCYNCHNKAQMITKHAEKGITDLSNCVACHPTGKGD